MSAASGTTHVEITDAADVAVGESAAAATAFEPVAGAKDPWTTSPVLKEYRTKWGLGAMRCATLRFDAKFEPSAATAFLLDLFNSAAARAATGAPLPDGCRVTRVHAEPLRTTVTSTDFFDRLADAGIVAGDSGYLRQRLAEEVDGVTVADDLRDMLLRGEESDHGGTYTDDEQREFIYGLFRCLAVGGAMCQFEDTVTPYVDATRQLYKAALTVAKDPASGRPLVRSLVYAVSGVDVEAPSLPTAAAAGGAAAPSGAGGKAAAVGRASAALFPKDNPHNVCWVVVDAPKRTCQVWYHAWTSFW